MNGNQPKSEYTKELDRAVKAIKASEQWRREYMTLIERDRENFRLGGYAKTVSSIRENVGIVDDDMLMKVLQLTPNIFYLVKDEISKHPDWDDEKVAEEIEWS